MVEDNDSLDFLGGPGVLAATIDSMLIIGLTGGIGCGKSAAAARFAEHGVPVIDADDVAREVVQPGREGLRQIIETFGEDMLTPDGTLDRAKLRKRIFSDPAARESVEAILHPLIRQRMQQLAQQVSAPYCLFVIPLLLETGQQEIVDRVLVVDCPPDLQRRRVRERDGSEPEEIEAILAAQVPRDRRLQAADDIIENDREPAHLPDQVDKLHALYTRLGHQDHSRP